MSEPTENEDSFAHLHQAGLDRLREITCYDGELPQIEQGTVEDIAFKLVFGEVWNRSGMSARDRRLVTLGVLAALGIEHELPWHVKGALKSGDLTEEELREIAVQVAFYAGFPRAATYSGVVREATGQPTVPEP